MASQGWQWQAKARHAGQWNPIWHTIGNGQIRLQKGQIQVRNGLHRPKTAKKGTIIAQQRSGDEGLPEVAPRLGEEPCEEAFDGGGVVGAVDGTHIHQEGHVEDAARRHRGRRPR